MPGCRAPDEGQAERAARRIRGGLNRLVAAAHSAPVAAGGGDVDWADLMPAYVEEVRAEVPDLSPAVAALALRVWGRMHGLVTLEVHGRLGAASQDPAALYRTEMVGLAASLGRA